MRKAQNKILGRTLFIVFTVLFICVIALSFVPTAMGLIPCSISTDSMEPYVKKGSYVLSKPVKFGEIEVSDILLFEVPKTGERFVRRVADIYEDDKQLVTSDGEVNGLDPMTTSYSCVLGEVVYSVPYVGYPYMFADSLTGKSVIILFYIVWAAIEIEIYSKAKRGEHPNE